MGPGWFILAATTGWMAWRMEMDKVVSQFLMKHPSSKGIDRVTSYRRERARIEILTVDRPD